MLLLDDNTPSLIAAAAAQKNGATPPPPQDEFGQMVQAHDSISNAIKDSLRSMDVSDLKAVVKGENTILRDGLHELTQLTVQFIPKLIVAILILWIGLKLTKMLKKEAGDRSGLIYGLGHPIYTMSDPRALILKENARRLAEEKGFGDDFRLAEMIERLAPELMKSVRGISKPICANVDFYSGIVYETLGIPVELYTPLFAAARIAGWIAHRIEEISANARIIRPAYRVVYDPQPYISIDNR